MSRRQIAHQDHFRSSAVSPGPGAALWNSSRSVAISSGAYHVPIGMNGHGPPPRVETSFPVSSAPRAFSPGRPTSVGFLPPSNSGYGPLNGGGSSTTVWNSQSAMYSPTDSVDDIIASSNLSDCSLDNDVGPGSPPSGPRYRAGRGGGVDISGRPAQRRPSNRDEFDGPHHFLQPPSAEYKAMQERDLPHLPTNLPIQEQDYILRQMNERLSKCAFDFVAKYQFPIPLAPNTRPVEKPQDRDWVEWVYLLKRLATKRRIPARVLYNGQIKQFVPTLEHSLEMRYAPSSAAGMKNGQQQRRPLKDDRHVLQLLSAGIQVAKILRDPAAMEFLDKLYASTEKQIQERAPTRYRG
ncbi:hypothetical protein jhhlp_004635 [Lomentospora prolificans]|uniref:Uncharacterized protein n=1 Tax=Lomentospora prolificans TaxID=41688 RepID=A0A2N3NC42_9PEZI|nr:hypothetical protein jhhlp_004635 [Lomentospora prolificans]